MATVSHARFHPPAPPTAIAPPTAVWEANDLKSKNLSPAFMRPLYANCREHYHSHHHQQFRWQQQRRPPGPPAATTCEHHHRQHQQHHQNRQQLQQSNERDTAVDATATTASIPAIQSPAPVPAPSPHKFLVLNDLPRMPAPDATASPASLPAAPTALAAPSPPRVQHADPTVSPFLRLPVEIRLQIYALLILPSRASDLVPNYERVSSSMQDSFNCNRDAPPPSLTRPVLQIRTLDPEAYHERFPPSRPHARSLYSVRASRFRARCMQTTYHCVNVPRIEPNLGILRTCRAVHAEACELLYGAYTFDFDTHVEAVVPFLADLSPVARRHVRAIRLVKRALAYDKEFDRAEWSNALRYLTSSSTDVRLRRLELGVVAGRPGAAGWDRIAAYSPADFGMVRRMEGMEWMQYLLEFSGLSEVDVKAVVEHCPPVTSSTAMANYVRFSASVEGGFREFLRSHLLGGHAKL